MTYGIYSYTSKSKTDMNSSTSKVEDMHSDMVRSNKVII